VPNNERAKPASCSGPRSRTPSYSREATGRRLATKAAVSGLGLKASEEPPRAGGNESRAWAVRARHVVSVRRPSEKEPREGAGMPAWTRFSEVRDSSLSFGKE
jgi:hypothetical protein